MIIRTHNKRTSSWAARNKNKMWLLSVPLTPERSFQLHMSKPKIYQQLCYKCRKDCKVVYGKNSTFICYDYDNLDNAGK